MDWVTGIQRALDYAEAHLTEEIDYEEAAKRPIRPPFIFSVCSRCSAVFRSGIISVCAA